MAQNGEWSLQYQDRKRKFSFDLSNVDLNKIRLLILNKKLLPARKILLDSIDQQFYIIDRLGIKNLKDLLYVLSTKRKIQTFSERSGIDIEYLKILKREAGSYIPKPVKFQSLTDVDNSIIEKLETINISTNKDLLEHIFSEDELQDLSDSLSIDFYLLNELLSLSDLSRIPGVGPVFAKILLAAGISSLDDFRNIPPESILKKANEIIERDKITKAKLTIKDIEYSKELSQFLE